MQNREKLRCPSMCPPTIYDALNACWKLDPSTRIAASEIIQQLERYTVNDQHMSLDFAVLDWPQVELRDDVSSIASVSPIDIRSEECKSAFNQLEVPASDVRIEHELGKGQFGTVSAGLLLKDGGVSVAVAIKSLLDKHGVPELERQQFEYEARLLSALRHANIVSVLAVCFKQSPNLIVLEMMKGGDLRSYLRQHKDESEEGIEQLMGACLQISDAMSFLERHSVVHRDLAARFVHDPKCILCDLIRLLTETCSLERRGSRQ